MIDPTWKRICGIQCQDEGTIGAVWMAHEKPRDLIHVYDACIFRNEVWAVIAEGLNCRGRNIPIAWNKKQKDIADKLLERGCNMLYDPLEESAATTEVWSREILERMKTGRFKVDKRIKEWLDEYQSYYRDESEVPTDAFPLMAATRCAVSQLQYAKGKPKTNSRPMAPKLAII